MKAKNINVDSNGQEITERINGFPISCYSSRLSAGTYDYIDWHWHLEFQLCLTQTGTVMWSTGGSHCVVPEGKGIFINSQRVHMAKPFQCEEATFFCVDFSPDYLCPERKSQLYAESVRPVLDNVGLQMITIDSKKILGIMEGMAERFEFQEKGYEFLIASDVLRIWSLLQLNLSTNENGSNDLDERFRQILTYVQNHYHEIITLNEIASHIGLSRSECCRYFKKRSGQTIIDYLTQYRLHKSMEELRQNDKSISRIALDCGFQSQSYYTKRFRELTGMTPGQFRKQLAKEF